MLITAPYRYYTAFPLSETGISEHSSWIDGAISSPRTSVKTDGQHSFATMSSFNGTDFPDSIAVMKRAFPLDQWFLFQIWNQGAVTGQEVEGVLWGTIQPTNNTGLEFDCVLGDGHMDLVAWLGPANSFTTLASATGQTFNDLDYLFGQIKAGVVTCKKGTSTNTSPIAIMGDLTTILTHDTSGDSLPFRGGTPGQGHWNQTGSSAASPNLGMRKWWCGTFDASGNPVY